MSSLEQSYDRSQRTYCTTCGASNRATSHFCTGCGSVMRAQPSSDAMSQPTTATLIAASTPTSPPTGGIQAGDAGTAGPPPPPAETPARGYPLAPPPPLFKTAPPPAARASEGRSHPWIRYVLISLAVVAAVVVALLLYPRAEIVVSGLEVPDVLVSGDTVVASVRLANEGRGAGEYDLTVLVDGEPAQSTTVSLAGRGEETVEVVLGDLAPGTYEIAVADWEGADGVVWVMTPPEFEVDWIDVTPNPMDVNESADVTVVVQVTNVGEADGIHDLQLLLDGAAGESRSIALEGGATAEESFAATVDGPGVHEVSVGGATVTVDAYQLERLGNGTEIINEIDGGVNEFRIINNFDEDVVVVLAEPGDGTAALLSVYVHANDSHAVRTIQDGTYSTYFVHGSSWCTYCNEFKESPSYSRFEGDVEFRSTATRYAIYTVEFGIEGVPGEPTPSVASEEFPTM